MNCWDKLHFGEEGNEAQKREGTSLHVVERVVAESEINFLLFVVVIETELNYYIIKMGRNLTSWLIINATILAFRKHSLLLGTVG